MFHELICSARRQGSKLTSIESPIQRLCCANVVKNFLSIFFISMSLFHDNSNI